MKNFTSKLIALVLAVTLVFSMSGIAFAGSGGDHPADIPEICSVTEQMDVVAPAHESKEMTSVKSTDWDPVNVKYMVNSTYGNPAYSAYDLQPDTYILAEVTAPTTGWMWFDYALDGEVEGETANIYLCESFDIDTLDYSYYPDSSGELENGYEYQNAGLVYAKKGQSFYIYAEALGTTGDQLLEVRAKQYSTVQNRTLPVYSKSTSYMWISGIGAPSYDDEGNFTYSASSIYVKIKPSKTGVMTVDLKESGYSTSSGYVTLYDANKNRISDSKIIYNSSKTASKAYFGVTKGKTYYIRVQNCYGTEKYGYRYGIRYSVASATDRSLAKTSAAKKLTKGTTYSTLFRATNATGLDYYKLYVSSKKTTKFTVDTTKIRSGKVYVRVYKNGKQIGKTKTINPSATKTTYTITYGSTSGKATKGTYYIKVSKSAKCSGLYKIKYTQ